MIQKTLREDAQLAEQNHEAVDAAKLLKIAKTNYELPDELERIMCSDCLFALGFYDQAEVVFEDMFQTQQDPILVYNLAVTAFHLLQFDKADQRITQFLHYFSDNPEFTHKAAMLQERIACFRERQPIEEISKEHPFVNIHWDDHIAFVMCEAVRVGKGVELGIDALCQIEVADQWQELSGISTVSVVPLTIVRVMELYWETGAPVFYQIILKLSELQNLDIVSPDLNVYLAVKMKNPELPPHYIMEHALFIQDQMVDQN